MELNGSSTQNSRLSQLGWSSFNSREAHDSRYKVLVPELHTWESGLADGGVVRFLVVLHQGDLLVGTVTVLVAEEEGDLGRQLEGECLQGEDSVGLSI